MPRRRQRLAAAIAILAMALHARWPLVVQAKPRSVTLVPVCTVEGVTHYLELASGESPLEKQTAQHGEHCAFCTFESGRADLLIPTAIAPLVHADGAAAVFDQAAVTEAHPPQHPPARPRAPPVIS